MLRFFAFAVIVIIAALAGYLSFTKLDPQLTADPIVKLLGPGDRPSLCAQRAQPYFDRNKSALKEIAETLIADQMITDILISPSTDIGSWRASYIDGNAHIYERVEVSNEIIELYLPLVRKLESGSYYSPLLFQQSEDGQQVSAIQPSPTCGISSLDWIKLRLNLGELNTTKPYAAAIGFEYWPNGIVDPVICEEPVVVPNAHRLCSVAIDDNWAWVSRWWPEYMPNILSSEWPTSY